MLKRLAAATFLAALTAGCSSMPQSNIDPGTQATLDIQNNCVNLPPGPLETCRRSGTGGLSGAGSPSQ